MDFEHVNVRDGVQPAGLRHVAVVEEDLVVDAVRRRHACIRVRSHRCSCRIGRLLGLRLGHPQEVPEGVQRELPAHLLVLDAVGGRHAGVLDHVDVGLTRAAVRDHHIHHLLLPEIGRAHV